MPKAKAKRTLADDLTAEDIREAFARAGSERKLKPKTGFDEDDATKKKGGKKGAGSKEKGK